MRILFVCNPLYGHLYPLLPLAGAARAAGNDVVVATGADLTPLARSEGLSAWPAGLTHEQAGGNRQDSWLEYFEAGARQRIRELNVRLAMWHPDLVVHEETELAGPVIATNFGARSIVHGLGPTPPQRLLQWIASALERLAQPGEAGQVLHTWRSATYLHPCPPALAVEETPIWPSVMPLRPTTPGRTADATLMRCIDRLPHDQSVFVTLGTVYGANTAALVAAVDGLRRHDVNVIVATGPGIDPAFIDGKDSRALVRQFVPLASVLARCTAVVSQGGSGVMLGAMAHGLPQLMLPQGADQFRNAEVCASTGATLSLAPQEATVEAVSCAVQRLLHEDSFSRSARQLRRQIISMPDVDAVVMALTAQRALEASSRKTSTTALSHRRQSPQNALRPAAGDPPR